MKKVKAPNQIERFKEVIVFTDKNKRNVIGQVIGQIANKSNKNGKLVREQSFLISVPSPLHKSTKKVNTIFKEWAIENGWNEVTFFFMTILSADLIKFINKQEITK